jgi:hypothetical protein
MKIEYSRGTNIFDNQPTQHIALNFDDFQKEILGKRSKTKGIGYYSGAFAEGRHTNQTKYPGVSTFRQAHLERERRFLPFDFDGFRDEDQFFEAIYFFHEYRGFSYTTHSHLPWSPRMRVILELTRGVTSKESLALGDMFEETLEDMIGPGFNLDRSVFRNSQPIFVPPTHAQVDIFKGNPVDVDEFIPLDFWAANVRRPNTQEHNFETPRQRAYLEEALSHISADCDYELYRRVIWGILSSSWECAEDIAYNWSNTCPERFEESTFINLLNSFDSSREHRPTLNTVFKIARENGWKKY